ncbi:MAG: LysM peptidoglycan-binding domain-containing protein [Planctomycetota bacterium]|nr:MAG: LysM peptidoglycan-binding domain-containing protein [Planctomycetota bacterium]
MVDAGIPPRAAHGESAARRTSAGAGPPPSAGTAALPPAHNAQWRILRDDTTTPRAAPRNPFETHARPNAEHSGSVDRPDAGKGRVERLDPPPGPAPIAAGHHTAAKPAVPLTPAAASERSPQTDSTNARRGDGASPGGYRIHVVRRGETLSEIALRYLGSVARYREIFDANRDVLRDPDSIREGMTLRIPTARSAAPRNRPIPAHRIRAARDAQ